MGSPTTIITSDIHETEHPRDEYRWGLFPWLAKQVKKHSALHVYILGDLTEAKDHHAAKLVNRFCEGVRMIILAGARVVILKANHDYVDADHPFFKFLSLMHTDVIFVDKPTVLGKRLFLPHTKHWKRDWKEFIDAGWPYDYIFCHQTFEGAKAENGQTLRGIPPSVFKGIKGQAISGDVHSPQRLSRRLLYVGAPYRTKFGDAYRPRCLLLRGNELLDLHFPCVTREVVHARSLQDVQTTNLPDGTQVKIRVRLKRSEYPEWPVLRREIKRVVKDKKWELCGLALTQIKSKSTGVEVSDKQTPKDVVLAYAKRKKLTRALTNRGLTFLKGD